MGRRATLEQLEAAGATDGAPPAKRRMTLEQLEAAGATTEEDVGQGRAAILALAQGGTKRWADELGGWLADQLSPAPAQLTPQAQAEGAAMGLDVRPTPTVGERTKELMREEAARASRQYPKTTIAGEVVGDIGSDVAAGLLGAPAVGLPYQIATGALTGAGGSTAKDAGGLLLDTGIGAGTSLAGYGAAKVIQPIAGAAVRRVASEAREFLPKFAGQRAIKATGAIQSDIKGVAPERLQRMGQQLLREDVVTAGAGKTKVLERAGEGLERYGALIGDTLERADAAAAKAGAGAFEWGPVMMRINKEIRDKLGTTGRRLTAPSIAAPTGAYAPSFFDDIAQEAAGGGGYAAANRLKTEISSAVNWVADPDIKKRVARQLVGILNDEIEQQMEKRLGGQAAQEFKTAKELYGAMKFAKKGATHGLERQTGNRMFQPSDMGLGAAELAGDLASGASDLAGLGKAAAWATAHKLARERGSSVAAVAADRLSRSDILKELARYRPEALGRYAVPLADAARRGDQQFSATDYVLSQRHPEYRQMKEGLEQQ